MQKYRLNLYHIDMKYIRDLAKADDRVMSVSPQIGKEKRPFVGIVILCESKKYCIPLTSPKPKHLTMKNDKDFTRMFDKNGKMIGCLNFNNMIPVSDSVLSPVNMKLHPEMREHERKYVSLLNDQLDWCNENQEAFIRKAEKLYRLITENPDKLPLLTKRCCDFIRLETVLSTRY